MRAPAWTSAAPTAEGYYWLWCPDGPMIVKVVRDFDGEWLTLVAGSEVDCPLTEHVGVCQWAGPLVPPEVTP